MPYDLTGPGGQYVDPANSPSDIDSGGLIINYVDPIDAGSGNYNTFLSIHNKGSEEGFNLNHLGPSVLDEGQGKHTHALLLSDVGMTSDAQYYVFRLDVNEPNSTTHNVTLTGLNFYVGPAAVGADWNGSTLINQTLVYSLNTDGVTLLDHSHGSGTDDYQFLLPASYFAGLDPSTTYLTLFASFGGTDASNGGFEEFRVEPPTGSVIPQGHALAIIKDTYIDYGGANETSVEGIDPAHALNVLAGTPLTWTYDVSLAPGSEPVDGANITVTDDHLGVTPTAVLNGLFNSGDTNQDGILESNETWHYTATGTAVEGAYLNVGTAAGTQNGDPLLATDISFYNGLTPSIDIEKTTTADDGHGHSGTGDPLGTVLSGTPVTWTYTVTNNGDIDLTNVTVRDDNGTAAANGDDFFASLDTSTDVGNDGILSPGESWTFTATGTSHDGSFTNTALASGTANDAFGDTQTVHDDDTSGYSGVAPSIHIEKTTTANDGLGHSGTGDPLGTILSGTGLTWTYAVTNNGDIGLTNVSVHDDNGTAANNGDDFFATLDHSTDVGNDGILSPGETWTFTATGTSKDGSYTNTAVATGTATDSIGQSTTVHDDDTSGYSGVAPAINIVKTTTGADANGVTHTGDNISVLAGTAVTWTYTVTDAGDTPLSSVTVTDNIAGVNPVSSNVTDVHGTHNVGDVNGDGVLQVGEAWVFTATGTAQLGAYSNIGTASGSFTDSISHTKTVTATDGSNYTGTFTQATSGLTIGYWYNHQTIAKNSPTAPFVDKYLSYMPTASGPSGYTYSTAPGTGGVLLGDANHNGRADVGETTLWIPRAAAIQLLNSSQTANDTRQILLSQAIGTQLNIDNGTPDPGYHGAAGGDLITEAAQWLRGLAPYTYTDAISSKSGTTVIHSTGNVDGNGNGILDTSEYDPAGAKALTIDANGSLSGVALTSNLQAWQGYKPYDAFDYNHLSPQTVPGLGSQVSTDYWADGEGLKNALQAVNQNTLVSDPTGTVVAWNPSGSVTGPYSDFHLNGPNDFWVVLSDHSTYYPGVLA